MEIRPCTEFRKNERDMVNANFMIAGKVKVEVKTYIRFVF